MIEHQNDGNPVMLPPGVKEFLSRERLTHEEFAASRRRIYVQLTDAMDELDRFAETSDFPRVLIVTGASGSGKSALLANWTSRYRRANRDAFVIEQYVGASPATVNHIGVIRRVMAEIKARYNLTQQLPVTPEAVEEELPLWLARVQGEQLVVVIDAVDQLVDGRSLNWLPSYLHSGVTLVVSTALPALLHDGIGVRTIALSNLSKEQRSEIAQRYMQSSGSQLNLEHVKRITESTASANALFLRVSLDETRRIANLPTRAAFVDKYLEADSLDELLDLVLIRLEGEYGSASVGTMLSLLDKSRTGLLATDLSELLELPLTIVTELVAAVRPYTISAVGRQRFLHEHLRKRIAQRYESDSGTRTIRYRLAEHASRSRDPRFRADEEPWHWLALQEFGRLRQCLCNPEILHELFHDDFQDDLVRYWRALEGVHDVAQEYSTLLASGALGDRPDDLEQLGNLMTKLGRLDDASAFYDAAMEYRVSQNEPDPAVAKTLHRIGVLQYHLQNYALAEDMWRRALDRTQHGGWQQLELDCDLHCDFAALLYQLKRFEEAEKLCNVALQLAVKANDRFRKAECLNNLGAINAGMGHLNEASTLLTEALELNRSVFGEGHPQVARNRVNLGTIESLRENLKSAEVHFRSAASQFERMLGSSHPSTINAYAHLGNTCLRTGRLGEAVRLLENALTNATTVYGHDHPMAALLLANLAKAKAHQANFEEAVSLCETAVRIFVHSLGPDHQMSHDATDALAQYRRGHAAI
jgi:nephrocystin-3